MLRRRGLDIEALTARAAAFRVAVPSWGVGTGGTRFARFPGAGRAARHLRQARRLRDDLPPRAVDAGGVPPHPVGPHRRPAGVERARARARAPLRRDELEYVPGPGRPAPVVQVRQPDTSRRAPCGVRPSSTTSSASGIGAALGSYALSVWIGDGGNFPGQMHARRALQRYIDSMRADLRRRCRRGWRLFLEHKLYEPAFYSTVINDWGTSYYCRDGSRPAGAMPRRPRTPRAERQHRDDRGAADPGGQAGRVPLQRQQVRRRRPRRRVGQAVPAVPGVQRAGGRRAGRACPGSTRPTCSTSRTT